MVKLANVQQSRLFNWRGKAKPTAPIQKRPRSTALGAPVAQVGPLADDRFGLNQKRINIGAVLIELNSKGWDVDPEKAAVWVAMKDPQDLSIIKATLAIVSDNPLDLREVSSAREVPILSRGKNKSKLTDVEIHTLYINYLKRIETDYMHDGSKPVDSGRRTDEITLANALDEQGINGNVVNASLRWGGLYAEDWKELKAILEKWLAKESIQSTGISDATHSELTQLGLVS